MKSYGFWYLIITMTGATIIVQGLGQNGPLAAIYEAWVAELAIESQASFPASYRGLVSTLAVTLGLLVAAIVAHLLSARLFEESMSTQFSPHFYSRITLFCQGYFNDRIHETKKGTFGDLMRRAEAHDAAIVNTLYNLRETLKAGYKDDDIRITLMVPEYEDRVSDEGEAEAKLFIRYWANKNRRAPTTFRNKTGFLKGEGYAGEAWKKAIPQIGGRKKLLVMKEQRYKETSPEQAHVRSFCSIPIFDEGPEPDGRPLLAVLNIDATKRLYFPLKRKKAQEFCSALLVFQTIINFHLTQVEQLEAEGDPK